MNGFSYITAKKIVFGINSVNRLKEELDSLKAKKAVIITDKVVSKIASEITQRTHLNAEVWDEAEAEPSLENAKKCVEFVRGGRFDCVIGIGGGSSLDLAKMAAASLASKEEIDSWIGKNIECRAPLVLIPTTAGTGSEVSNAAVFATPSVKYVFYGSALYPDVAIVSPELTLSVPQKTTANTGIDALCHAVESYVSLEASPITEQFSLRAIELISHNIRRAYAHGDDINAREKMSLAALMAGIAFGNAGTVLGHACGYAYVYPATNLHLPHGFSIGIMAPYVLEYNAIADFEKHAKIAELLGAKTDGLPLRDRAFMAARAFKDLLKDLGIPTSLKELDIKKEQISDISKNVFKNESHVRRNPRKVNEKEMVSLFEKAYEGIIYENSWY